MQYLIVGVDEAGRGPLAGRVYAAAVILKSNITGLNDSKKLSAKKRDKMYDIIKAECLDYSVAYCEHYEIDKINILRASFLAMERAVSGLTHKFDELYVDGNIYPFQQYKGKAIIGGDAIEPAIMAASILAKVERDRYMEEMDKLYPVYNFISHKGYPTKVHKDLVAKYGPSPIHRLTFKGVKEFVVNQDIFDLD